MAIDGQGGRSFEIKTFEKAANGTTEVFGIADRATGWLTGTRTRVALAVAVLLSSGIAYALKDGATEFADNTCSEINGGVADMVLPDAVCRTFERLSVDYTEDDFDDLSGHPKRQDVGSAAVPNPMGATPTEGSMPVVSVAPEVPQAPEGQFSAAGMYPYGVLRTCGLLPQGGFDSANGTTTETGNQQMEAEWDKMQFSNPGANLPNSIFEQGKFGAGVSLSCPAS